jgi:hypothetical protein
MEDIVEAQSVLGGALVRVEMSILAGFGLEL